MSIKGVLPFLQYPIHILLPTILRTAFMPKRILLLTLFFNINFCMAALTTQPRPQWVKPIEAKQIEPDKLQDNHNTYVNLYDHQTHFIEKKLTQYTHIASQVLNSNGLQELGKLEIEYDPIYQQLNIHQVMIIRGNERIDVLDTSEFEVIRNENQLDQGIYSGTETALLLIKDLQAGDMLEYAYSIEGQNPIYDDKLFDVFRTQWSVQLGELFLKLTIPRDLSMDINYHKKKIKPKITKKGKTTTYQWHEKNIKAIDYEGNYPRWYRPMAYFELSEYSQWQQVAQWAYGVFDIDQTLNDEIKAHISKWSKIARSEQEKVAYALSFVQENIRYMGIELGVNSHQPRKPMVTYESKFGDCKDKTILLKAILNYMGIKATPALVSTTLTKGLKNRLPNPKLFDHVILHVQLKDGVFWLDPTSTNQGSSLDSLGLPDFGYAMLINNDTQSLTKIDRLATQNNIKSITEKFTQRTEADIYDLHINTNYTGDFAEYWRAAIDANTIKEINNQFESFYIKYYNKVKSIEPVQFEDQSEINHINATENYEIDGLWAQSGRFEALETYASNITDYVSLPARPNRKSPLSLNHPIELNHKFIIDQAESIINDDMKTVHISTKDIDYRRTFDRKEGQIHIHHHYKTLSDHVNSEDLAEHLKSLRQIRKALSVTLVRKMAFEEKIQNSENRLKDALRSMLKENNND